MPNVQDFDFNHLTDLEFLNGLDFLIQNRELSANKLNFNRGSHQWSSRFFGTNSQGQQELTDFLSAAITFAHQEDKNTTLEQKKSKNAIRNYYDIFLNLNPNHLIANIPAMTTQVRPLAMTDVYRKDKIPFARLLPNQNGDYISPDDHHHGEHEAEARRIGASTQFERLKGWVNEMMSHLGIHVFETARYAELDYLNSTIYANDPALPQNQEQPSYYWIGHASNLIVIPVKKDQGQNRPLHVLTDPVEGDLFPGLYPRQTKEGKLIKGKGDNRLPRVDVVVISHNHRDHVDTTTLCRLLDQQPKMIVPEGDKQLFIDLGFKNVEALNWGDSININQGEETLLEITAVPARHWSGRGLHDSHKSVFSGYVLQAPTMKNQDIYFAGDTAVLGDETSQNIYQYFNIGLSIQPGGPDENRSDMKSTHQSSADGITAHFINLKAQYDKNKLTSSSLFFNKASQMKTIYDHTATFKLGNLRLRDTYYSYTRVLAAFKQEYTKERAKSFLAAHEFAAYQQIKIICADIKLDGNALSDKEIADLIENNIIVPRIGQRLDINKSHSSTIATDENHRAHIINHRAIKSCDEIAMKWLEDQKNPPSKNNELATSNIMNNLIMNLLESYRNVWHSRLTRTHLDDLNKIIKQKNSVDEKLDGLQKMLSYENLHGHLQNIVHYGQWINKTIKTPEALADYLTRLHVRCLVNEQIKIEARLLIEEKRDGKQERFNELAQELVKAESLNDYRARYTEWKAKNIDYLSKHRSKIFYYGKTQSEETLEQIEKVLKITKN